MLLVYGIRILICQDTFQILNKKTSQYLRQFVINYSFLYGRYLVTYNAVYSLIHLPMFSLDHEVLGNYSAFRYENYFKNLTNIYYRKLITI